MLKLLTSLLALSGTACAQIIVKGAANGRMPRKEIRDLAAIPNEWAVYVQALIVFQNVSQSNPLSFYGISTIHGFPGGSYDGSVGVGNGNPINCPHSSIYFPAWHRAYLMLYEQQLQQAALQVAATYPSSTRATFLDIAKKLRSPFWDWAIQQGGTAYPTLFSADTLTINGPNGQTTVTNPLKRYRFNPSAAGLRWAPYSSARYTVRSPQNSRDMNSLQQDSVSRRNVDNISAWCRDRILRLLTRYTDYNQISNSAWITSSDVNAQDSFEGVHDNIHGAVGGQTRGFMSMVPVSTYDPIFWLHHTNIDRLIAMFQAIQPDAWWGTIQQKGSTFWYQDQSDATPDIGLVPFKKNANGDYWTSSDLRDWTVGGYNYKDTPAGHTPDIVRGIAQQKYGSGSSSSKRDVSMTKSLRSRFFSLSRRGAATLSETTTDYYINMRANKNALGKPYTVYAFLCTPNDDYEEWISNPHLVGFQSVLARSDLTNPKPIYISAQLLLTRALNKAIASGALTSTKPACVEKFLKHNLAWKVVDSDGKVYHASQVPSLALSVGVTKYGVQTKTAAGAADFRTYGPGAAPDSGRITFKSDLLPDVYEGKAAALNNTDLYSWGVGHINV